MRAAVRMHRQVSRGGPPRLLRREHSAQRRRRTMRVVMEAQPVPRVRALHTLEFGGQRHARALRSFRRTATERECRDEHRDPVLVSTMNAGGQVHLSRERDVAIARLGVLRRECARLAHLPPAVVHADVSATRRAPARARRERERHVVPAGEQHRDALVLLHPPVVAVALVADVRRQQHEHPVVLEPPLQRTECHALHEHRALGISDDHLLYLVVAAGARVHEAIARHRRADQVHRALGVSLLLREEAIGPAHEQPEVARVGLVHARVVDLVHDAVRHGEPHVAAPVERRADSALGARRPARLGSWSAWRRKPLGRRRRHAHERSRSHTRNPPRKAFALLPRRVRGGNFGISRTLPPPSTV